MATVTCKDCGRELPDESSGADPAARVPCPWCGSIGRNFQITLGGENKPVGAVELSVSVTRDLVERSRRERGRIARAGLAVSGLARSGFIGSTAQLFPPSVSQEFPEVLLAAEVLSLGSRTPDGQLVVGVALPWFEIIRHLDTDPAFMFKLPWRKWEEMVAGAFERDGWPEVVLTPPSGDKGRDVIATRPGVGSVRIIGQMKAYSSGHVVDAEEVAAMFGTLHFDKASKAMVMTTSDFAPGVLKDGRIQPYVPFQLELMNGDQLRDWLLCIEKKRTRS